ncbi:hypothetical protein UT4_19930 [Ferrigenium sp. UT4]
MPHKKPKAGSPQDFLNVESNQGQVRMLFRSYYRSHQTSGKLFDDFPDFFLVKPIVLKDPDLVQRASDRLIIDDCIARAQERKGYVGVCKWRNPKLNYYWLELAPFPFVLGDKVSEDNEGEFFYLLHQFILYTRENPKRYGDMTANAEQDKDLALMLEKINHRGAKLEKSLGFYALDMLVRYDPAWPLGEVNKLLTALKNSELDWCELFFEHTMYVMAQKHQ